MGVITQAVMVQAAIDVNGMGQDQKMRLADEIFAQQPNMLASILVLPRMGVGMVELQVPLHILFVTFQAMKRSGHTWPVVSEEVQDKCMQRLTARVRFNEGLPGELADQAAQHSATSIPSATCSPSSTDTSRPRLAACEFHRKALSKRVRSSALALSSKPVSELQATRWSLQ